MDDPTAHEDGVDTNQQVLVVYLAHQGELARSLAREDYDVLTVDDTTRAQRLLKVFRPDVILVFGRDAATSCLQLRRENPDVPLLAIVPDDEPEHRVAALGAGADDCVSEPFHFAELRARVRVALRRHREDGRQSPCRAMDE